VARHLREAAAAHLFPTKTDSFGITIAGERVMSVGAGTAALIRIIEALEA